MKNFIFSLCLCVLVVACNNSLNSNPSSGSLTDSGSVALDTTSDAKPDKKVGSGSGATAPDVSLVMEESKKAIDAIDAADKEIRQQSLGELTPADRQQVNKALAELGNARDLITLKIQNAVISNLKIKTASLQLISRNINAQSEKLSEMAATLTRVSAVIESTTNMLASALSAGLVRPPMRGS